MKDTSLGYSRGREERRVPIVVRDQSPGLLPPPMLEAYNQLLGEGTEVPAIGVFSTAHDFHRFAEMLRRGGELDGVRLLSPLTLDLATKNYTGDKVNELYTFARESLGWQEAPAFLGLGFSLRGDGVFPHHFGALASPRTYGQFGAGSTVFWVDPARDVCFVGLTAGLQEESNSLLRWQRLSDITLSSIIEP